MDRIPLEWIVDNPFQARQVYDGIAELANSVLQMREARPETSGLIQVPVGRIVLGDLILDPGEYESVAACLDANPSARVQLGVGHRRLRAFQRLYDNWAGDEDEYETFPIEIQVLDDQAMADIAWEENIKRKDLSPIEEAEALRRAMETFGWSQAEVGERWGLSQPAVANKLRLLQLPDEAQEAIRTGQISERHGRALLKALGKSRRIYERAAEQSIPLPVDERAAVVAKELIGEHRLFAFHRNNITDPDGRRCPACGGPIGSPASGQIPAIHHEGEYKYFCQACARAGLGWSPPSTAETEDLVDRIIRQESNALDPNVFPLDREIGKPPQVQAPKCLECEFHEERDNAHWCLDSPCFREKKALWDDLVVLQFQEALREKFPAEALPEVITGWSGNDHSSYSDVEKAMVASGHCGPHCSRLRFRHTNYSGIRPIPEFPFIYNCDNTNAKNACVRRYLKSLETAEQQEAAERAKKAAEARRKEARTLLHRAEVSVARALKAGHEGAWRTLARTVGEETKEGQAVDISMRQVAKVLLPGDKTMQFVDWENDDAVGNFQVVVDVAMRGLGVGLIAGVEDLEQRLSRMCHFLEEREQQGFTPEMIQGNLDNLSKIVVEISDLQRDGLAGQMEFQRVMQWVESLRRELEGISREILGNELANELANEKD